MSFERVLIEVQYQNSMNCARELESCANVIKRVSSSDVGEILDTLQGTWEGDAARACIRKVSGVKDDVNRDGMNIQRTADVIRTIAENVRRAEITAYNLAHRRRY